MNNERDQSPSTQSTDQPNFTASSPNTEIQPDPPRHNFRPYGARLIRFVGMLVRATLIVLAFTVLAAACGSELATPSLSAVSEERSISSGAGTSPSAPLVTVDPLTPSDLAVGECDGASTAVDLEVEQPSAAGTVEVEAVLVFSNIGPRACQIALTDVVLEFSSDTDADRLAIESFTALLDPEDAVVVSVGWIANCSGSSGNSLAWRLKSSGLNLTASGRIACDEPTGIVLGQITFRPRLSAGSSGSCLMVDMTAAVGYQTPLAALGSYLSRSGGPADLLLGVYEPQDMVERLATSRAVHFTLRDESSGRAAIRIDHSPRIDGWAVHQVSFCSTAD